MFIFRNNGTETETHFINRQRCIFITKFASVNVFLLVSFVQLGMFSFLFLLLPEISFEKVFKL